MSREKFCNTLPQFMNCENLENTNLAHDEVPGEGDGIPVGVGSVVLAHRGLQNAACVLVSLVLVHHGQHNGGDLEHQINNMLDSSVVDPHHVDADPDADPDFYLMRIRIHSTVR
jgi:hypothetical protein